MKLIITIASFLVLCYASPLFGGRKISIINDDDILLTGNNGKKINILKKIGLNGEKFIEIAVRGPNMQTKKIRINDQNEFVDTDSTTIGDINKSGYGYDEDNRFKRDLMTHLKFSQCDFLIDILKRYQGIVDDATYLHLLNEIHKAVEQGLITHTIYYLLQNWNEDGPFDVYLDPYIVRHIDEKIIPRTDMLTDVEKLYRMDTMGIGNHRYLCGYLDIFTCMMKYKMKMGDGLNTFDTGFGHHLYGKYGDLGIGTGHYIHPLLHHYLGNKVFNNIYDDLMDNNQIDDTLTTRRLFSRVGGIGGIAPFNTNRNFGRTLGHDPFIIQRLMKNKLDDILLNKLYKLNMYGGKYGFYGGYGTGQNLIDHGDLLNNLRFQHNMFL